MFEFLKNKKPVVSPKEEKETKVIKRSRRVKRKSRVAFALTENDFHAFKRIGDVGQAHRELGISKGVLYMWKKLGNWEKISEFKAQKADFAKQQHQEHRKHKLGRPAMKKYSQNEVNEMIKPLGLLIEKLINTIEGNMIIVKKK